MNHYYAKWIGNGYEYRWNVIQVEGDSASYIVLAMGQILHKASPSKRLSVGWMEENEDGLWYTDGEDYICVSDWEKHEGTLK